MAGEYIGTYIAKAEVAEWSETKQNPDGTGGHPQITIKFKILDEVAGERRGRVYYWNGSLADTKMGDATVGERTVDSLKYCGARLKDGDLTDLDGITKNEVDVVLNREEFNGEKVERISFVNQRGGIFLKNPLSDDKKKAMVEKFKGLVNKVNAKMAKGSEVGGVPVDATGAPTF